MRRWFVILASIAILLILLRLAGFREVAATWRTVRPGGIALSVACYYGALLLRVVAWRRLLGPEVPSTRALAPPLTLGFVLGHVTPAKSGEPLTAVLVARNFGWPLSRTLSVLTVERALQLLVLLATFVPAAAIYAGNRLEIRSAAVAGAALLVVVALALAWAAPSLRRLAEPVRRLPRVGPAATRYLTATADLLAERRRAPILLLLATAFWFLQYLSLWAILDAGGASVNLIEAAVVSGAAILGGTLTLVPLGTQDGISALVLAGLGIPLARGFSLALFHTLLSLACGLVLLGLLPLTARRTKKGASPAPPSS